MNKIADLISDYIFVISPLHGLNARTLKYLMISLASR